MRPALAFLVCLFGTVFVTSNLAVASTPGTWGAGGYRYVDGAVCSQPHGITSPLAVWDVGAGRRAYLVAPVTSDGTTDSAVPPLPSQGAQTVSTVVPGMDGFGSDVDIATYAALLSGGGDAATLATAVLAKAGTTPPTCGGSPDHLVAAAKANAGPYSIDLSAAPAPAMAGAKVTVTATVHGGTGAPAKGVKIAFKGDVTPKPATDVTDADGHASTTFVAPEGSHGVAISATVSEPIGLRQVTVASSPSATNPTGASVAAIFPADPVDVTARLTVPLDLSAHPQVSAAGSVEAVALRDSFAPTAQVTGMNGHSGRIDFTVYGPAKTGAGGDCSQANLSDNSAVAATTSAVDFTGDQVVTAASWQPGKTGCYLVVAHVITTDATPEAEARSSPTATGARVAVIDAHGTIALPRAVEGAGELTAKITSKGVTPAASSASAVLDGPMQPDQDGSCAKVDWTKAPHSATADPVSGRKGAAIKLTSAAVRDDGCYRWRPHLNATLTAGASLDVPVETATVLVLAPTLSLVVDRGWTNTPNSVPATLTVAGLHHQPAHLYLSLTRVPMPPTGCSSANFADGARVQTATAPAPFRPDTEVEDLTVQTPTIGSAGCYRVVPVLTVDVNTAIRVVGNPPATDVIAAADPQAAPVAKDPIRRDPGFRTRVLIAAGIAALVELLLVGVVGTRAWRRRDSAPGVPLPESLVALVADRP